jgi:hypothetical protein
MGIIEKLKHQLTGERMVRHLKKPSLILEMRWRFRNLKKKFLRAADNRLFALPLEDSFFKSLWGSLILLRNRDMDKDMDCSFFESADVRKRSLMNCDGDGHEACKYCAHFKDKL